MKPLIDTETESFNRGKYEGRSLDHVARIDLDYVLWIARKSYTDEESREYLGEYLISEFGIEI